VNLKDRVALVTGGAHRVGKVIALSLAQQGASVLIHYHRSEQQARQTLDEITALGGIAEPLKGNLGNPHDIERMFVVLEARFGRLDVLVNNAATFHRGHVLEETIEDWDYVMDVNLRAPFLCGQRAAHLMLARGTDGVIINIGDAAGIDPWQNYPIHSVSKAGLLMLTRVMAHSLGPRIRVNAVVPGPVLAPPDMAINRWEQIGAALPLERTGTPEAVAQAVLALVENDFATGTVFTVDGGYSLLNASDLA
jgi:pteridine reductase